MKNLSKALALLVVMAIMISSVAMAAVFPDVPEDGSALANAINVDAALGLIKGYEDGTFQPEGSITRAEFAAIVVRMRNQEAQAQGAATTTDFADVPADHWAAGYINIASRLGIINGYGDGNFGPEDPVLYEQAIKMVVVALGYDKAVGEAGYPVGYLTQAGSMGLTSNLNGVNGAEANRGLVAQIVFNALDIPLMIQDGYGIYAQYVIADGYNTSYKQTVLSEYLGVVKVQGIVDSSSVLTSSSSKGETVNVKITNNYKTKHGDVFVISNSTPAKTVRFAVGATDASSFVGSKVMIYAAYDENSSDDPEIVYIAKETKGTYAVTLTSTQIEDVTDEGDYILVEFRETPKSKTTQSYRIDKGSNLYINGVATLGASVSAIRDALTNKFYGDVTFSNLAATNEYDTLEVTNYKNLVVEQNYTGVGRVTAKNTSASITYASNDNTVKATLYGTDGKEMDWEDLKEWDVLTYTEAEGSGSIVVYTAWLVENSVTGSVDGVQYEGTDDVVYEINGEYYELDNILSNDEILLGDEGIFYLDKLGNIAYYDTSGSVNGNYAFVSGAMYWKDFNPTIQVQLFNKEGKIETYLMNTSVKINGETRKLNNMKQDEIDELADTFEGKLVVYKTNSSGEISAIDTAKVSDKKNDFRWYGGKEFAEADYNAATNGFKPVGKSTVFATDKTVIFYAPQDSGYDKDDYEILSLASIEDDSVLENISFYNVDDNNEVGAILIKGVYDAVPTSSTIAVVQSKSSTTDTYGQDVFKINAFKDSTDISYVTNTKLGEKDIPTIGSVFIPVVGNNTINKIKHLTKVDGDTVELGKDAIDNDDVTYYMGNIKQIKGSTVILDDDTTIAVKSTANIYLYDTRVSERYALSKNEDLSAVLVTYDSKTGKTTYEDRGKEITDYVIFAREYQGRIVDVVLYINLEYGDNEPAPTEVPTTTPETTPVPEVE